MTINQKRVSKRVAVALAALLSLSMSGCRDTDYDLGNVDSTIGVGGNFYTTADNTTAGICLDDVLDLGNTNFLKVAPDGNYQIDVVDDETFAAHMWVRQFSLPSKTYKGTYNIDLGDLVPPAEAIRKVTRASDEVSFDAPMVSMDYSYSFNSDAITRLQYVGVDEGATLSVDMKFSEGVKKCLNNIYEVRFKLPECVECGSVDYNGQSIALSEGNLLTLHNVSPAQDLQFVIHVKGIYLDGTKADGSYMTYTQGEGVVLHASLGIGGTVKVGEVNIDQVRGAGRLDVDGTAVLSKMTVVRAKGGFTPTRQFGKVGGVSLRNIPSFLKDDEVNLDLYNPQLNIDIDSDVPFANKMTGAIVAKDNDGNVVKRIDVPEFSYKANGKSVISVRRRNQTAGGDTTVVVVPEICDIIRDVPDSIALIDLVGRGDDSQDADIELSRNYRGEMVLSVASGVALDKDAAVIYKHDYKGWNDKVKDVAFVETIENGVKAIHGFIRATADVENTIPAYLTLTAQGIDVNGYPIGDDRLEITVDKSIAASADGVTPVKTQVVVKITPKDNQVMKQLDGVTFRVKLAAKQGNQRAVTGVLLNAYHQTVKVTSLRIQKVGKIAVDLN